MKTNLQDYMSKIIIGYTVTPGSENGEPSFCSEMETEDFAGMLPCKPELVLELTGQWDGVSSCLLLLLESTSVPLPQEVLCWSRKVSVNDAIFSTHSWEKLNLLTKPPRHCNEHIIAGGEERKKLGVSLYLGQHQSLSVTYSLVLWEACG